MTVSMRVSRQPGVTELSGLPAVAREALSPTPMNCYGVVSMALLIVCLGGMTYGSLLVDKAVCFGQRGGVILHH
jgi:hypothetical protein